jgi:hypothetical protein
MANLEVGFLPSGRALCPTVATPGAGRASLPRNSHDFIAIAIAESQPTVFRGSTQEFVGAKAGDQPKAMTPMTPAITRALAAYSLRS